MLAQMTESCFLRVTAADVEQCCQMYLASSGRKILQLAAVLDISIVCQPDYLTLLIAFDGLQASEVHVSGGGRSPVKLVLPGWLSVGTPAAWP